MKKQYEYLGVKYDGKTNLAVIVELNALSLPEAENYYPVVDIEKYRSDLKQWFDAEMNLRYFYIESSAIFSIERTDTIPRYHIDLELSTGDSGILDKGDVFWADEIDGKLMNFDID